MFLLFAKWAIWSRPECACSIAKYSMEKAVKKPVIGTNKPKSRFSSLSSLTCASETRDNLNSSGSISASSYLRHGHIKPSQQQRTLRITWRSFGKWKQMRRKQLSRSKNKNCEILTLSLSRVTNSETWYSKVGDDIGDFYYLARKKNNWLEADPEQNQD
jgi:hypothetical protein